MTCLREPLAFKGIPTWVSINRGPKINPKPLNLNIGPDSRDSNAGCLILGGKPGLLSRN